MNNIESTNITWKFTPIDAAPFKSHKDIIVSKLYHLFKNDLLRNQDINFLIRYPSFTEVELRIFFTTDEFLLAIQKLVGSCKDSSTELFESAAGKGYFCTSTYCPSDKEMDVRKYLKSIALIVCDLHQKDSNLAVQVAVRAMFQEGRRGALYSLDTLKKHFHENSEYYRLLEQDENELNKFWELFYYCHNSTPLDHFYYHAVLGVDSFGVYTCPQLLSFFEQFKLNIPPSLSCEEKAIFYINKLYGNI